MLHAKINVQIDWELIPYLALYIHLHEIDETFYRAGVQFGYCHLLHDQVQVQLDMDLDAVIRSCPIPEREVHFQVIRVNGSRRQNNLFSFLSPFV